MPSVSALWASLPIAALVLLCLYCGGNLTGTSGVGVLLGLFGAAILYSHWRWAAVRPRIPRRIGRPRSARGGFTLASAIASLAVFTILMAICVQLLFTAARARQAAAARAQALAAAVSVIEQVRVGATSSATNIPTPGATCSLRWSPGPVPGTAALRAEATVSGQRVVLFTVVPARPGAERGGPR